MKNISWSIILFIAFIGCSKTVKSNMNSEKQNNKISILRFDKDLYQYLKAPSNSLEDSLNNKYPNLGKTLSLSVSNSYLPNDSDQTYTILRNYFSHPALMNIYYDASFRVYNNVNSFEDALHKVQNRIHEYMPTQKLPRLAMHVSGFKENVIVLNGLISLSCDKYLGSEYPAYQSFFEPYQRQQMTPEYIVRDYLKAWLVSDIVKQNDHHKTSLLTSIIHEGKILYILSQLLPDVPNRIIIGYTDQQLTWNQENEKNIWNAIIKQNHLYTTDYLIISKYILDAPFTSTISAQSPGRSGAWVGWQIVNEYIKKTNTSIEELLTADAATILKLSKYNP